MGEACKDALKLGFDGSIRLEFHGATVSSDGGLLAYRDGDDALALPVTVAAAVTDGRTGTNIRPLLTALLRQSACHRLTGYDDLNDADRLVVDPVMRQVGGLPSRHPATGQPGVVPRGSAPDDPPGGRPPQKPIVLYHNLTYPAATWSPASDQFALPWRIGLDV